MSNFLLFCNLERLFYFCIVWPLLILHCYISLFWEGELLGGSEEDGLFEGPMISYSPKHRQSTHQEEDLRPFFGGRKADFKHFAMSP